MKVRVVITLAADTKEEAMKLPVVLEHFQQAMEHNRAAGAFGDPENVTVHHLVKPGRWE